MGRFIWEIVLVAISLLLGGGLLRSSLPAGKAKLALLAWLPAWILTLPLRDGWFTLHGWGWPFWLILGVGVVALFSGKVRWFVRLSGALLLLLVVIFGVNWTFPRHIHWSWSNPWLWFAAALLLMVATTIVSKIVGPPAGGRLVVVTILGAILLAIIGGIMLLGGTSRTADNTKQRTVAAAPTSVPPSLANKPADCPSGFVVKLDPNAGASLFSQGLSPKTEEMRQQVLQMARQDPRVLQVYHNASPLGTQQAVQRTEELAPIQDGACFTADGIAKYHQWSGLWKAAIITPAQLPATGVNTGAQPGGPAFQQEGRIPPGTGVKVQFVDANGKIVGEHMVRLECGNPLSPKPVPGLPPKPPGVPPIVCPLDNPLGTPPDCFGPKSDKPSDYRHPNGDSSGYPGGPKPVVTADPTADPTPPPVQTSAPPPQAPGASPPPTTSPPPVEPTPSPTASGTVPPCTPRC